MLEFRVLGPLEVRADGRTLDLAGPRQRAVLAALLIEAGRVVPVDRLIDQLWGGEPPAAATGSLQAYVSNLRRILEPDRPPRAPATVLVTRPPGYVLQVEGDRVDAIRFERRLAHARELLDGGHPPEAGRVVAEALGWWRGPAYADFTYEPFAAAAIARLEELRLTAEEVRGEALLRSGDAAPAVAQLEPLVEEHPLRERFRELLVWALYRSGRQADALRECDAARALLREELGVDPGPGLVRLEAQILAHDPALGLVPPSAAPVGPPSSGAPGPVAALGDRPFVGRKAELDVLRVAWSEAAGGLTRAVLLTGEAGIGKTRLAEELSAVATAEGARVAWARCAEDAGAPTLWPWLTLLRELTGDDPALPDEQPADPAAAHLVRFRALERLAGQLAAAAREHPVVAVIDDLQWADEASHELLDLALRTIRGARLLLVATVRTDDDATGVLGRLARYDHVRRVDVVGLGAADVEAYIAALGLDATGGLAAQVHGRTGGNAFFVAEALRLLTSRPGDLAAVPGTVVDAVRRRLDGLPEDTRSLLATAAVAGGAFPLDVVRSASGMDLDRGLDALEPALLAHLVVEDEAGLGRFRFAHPIVQEALYAALTPARAARLHRRIADGLADSGAGPVEVAHHYIRAVPAGVAPEAAELARRAADEEEARLAYPAAATWRERAVELDGSGPRSTRRHELLVELSRAQFLAGDLARSHEILTEALALAEQLDDPQLVVETTAQTTSFTPWGWWRPGEPDLRVAVALERALGDARLPERAAVTARAQLAVELTAVPGRIDEAAAHADGAVTAARPLGDPLLLATALQSQLLVGTRPGGAAVQRRAATEMASLRPPDCPPEVRLVGQLVAATAGLALGDATGFDRAVEACWRDAAPRNQPVLHYPIALARVTAAMLRGDLAAAEEASLDAFDRYGFAFPGREDARAAQLLEIGVQRGDVASVLHDLEALGDRTAYSGAATLIGGVAALEAGDLDGAAAALRRSPEIPALPDFSWLYRLSLQAQLAAAVGSPTAADYYTALLPYAGQFVTLATAIVCRGPVDRFLALLAPLVEPARAKAHREAADEMARGFGLG